MIELLRRYRHHPRLPLVLGLLLSALASFPTLNYARHRISDVRGWEADNVARSIAGGHGFSFTGRQRWLWEQWNGSETTFHPTAWMEPVFTYLLAGMHWAFDERTYGAVYALNFVCIGLVLYWAWRLATRFAGPWAGAVTIVALAANVPLGISIFDTINNTAFSVAVVTAGALVAVRYFEQRDRRRMLELGLYMGFMILACPNMAYFLPLLALALAVLHWRDAHRRWQRPAIVVLLALAVISPWTLRNYLVFGELVLVRDGAGQLAWDGTVGAGATYAPETTDLALPPPWRSASPREAVKGLLVTDQRIAMHHYQMDTTIARPPAGYDDMNEAQRDKYYLATSRNYILQQPAIVAKLALAKIEVFVMRFGAYGAVTLALAICGAILLARERRSWPLTLMAIAYSAPFVIAVAYFGRYRSPIEPVLVVLAAVSVLRLVASVRGSSAVPAALS